MSQRTVCAGWIRRLCNEVVTTCAQIISKDRSGLYCHTHMFVENLPHHFRNSNGNEIVGPNVWETIRLDSKWVVVSLVSNRAESCSLSRATRAPVIRRVVGPATARHPQSRQAVGILPNKFGHLGDLGIPGGTGDAKGASPPTFLKGPQGSRNYPVPQNDRSPIIDKFQKHQPN
jgi:hypothetical protein